MSRFSSTKRNILLDATSSAYVGYCGKRQSLGIRPWETDTQIESSECFVRKQHWMM